MLEICFTGHRPNKLYGYDLNDPKYRKLIDTTQRMMLYLAQHTNDYDIEAKQGGALGFDTVSFISCSELRRASPVDIKIVTCVPFKNQPNKWPQSSQQQYRRMLQKSDEVIYVDTMPGYDTGAPHGMYTIDKMQKRNEYMVDNSRFVISCWDGSKSGTYNCIKYALSKGKIVYNIDPVTFKAKRI